MKIEINRSKFVEAINTVKDVAADGALAVISNIKIETIGNDSVKLTATNLDVVITTTVDGCTVKEPGVTTVRAKILAPMVGALTSETVQFASDEKNVEKATITGGEARFKIATIDAKEFPKAAEVEGVKMAFGEGEFKEYLRKSAYAASVDSTRRALMSVCFQGGDGKVTAVATDGRRLATISKAKDGIEDFEMILPMATAKFLQRMLGGDGDVNVTVKKGTQAKFEAKNWTIQTKLVDDQYPNWRQVVPKGEMTKIQVNRESFIEAIRQASVASAAVNTRINITLKDNVMTLSSWNDDETAAAKVMVPVKFDGDETKIALAPKYLMDALQSLDADEIWFNVDNGTKPITITSEEADLTAVVMPLRIN